MNSRSRLKSDHTAQRNYIEDILMLTLKYSSATPLALMMMLLLMLPGVVLGVQVRELIVLSPAVVGRLAQLECKWSSQDFYSIRWYKDDDNIFTIIPKTNVKEATDDVRGVTVDVDASNEYMIVLRDVVAATAGEYRCEVMGNKPSFVTSAQTKILTVAEVPEEVELTGLAAHYQVGDQLNITCAVRNARPAARISFYIDDKEVPGHSGLVWLSGAEYGSKADTFTTYGKLQMRLTSQHVPRTSVRCVGRISSVEPLEALRVILVDDAQPNHTSHSTGCSSSWRCEIFLSMTMGIINLMYQIFHKYS